MKIYAAAFLFFLSFTAVCRGSQYAVSMDSGVFPPGGEVDFVLYLVNQDQTAFSFFPDEIICTLKANGEKMQVVAKRLEPKQSAAAGDTSNKAAYFFELPTIIDGEVVITLSGIDVPRLVIEADSSQNIRREKAVAAQDMYPTFDSISTLYQSYFRNIGAYEPTYFLVGTDPEWSKFQISFKYQLFASNISFTKHHPWVKGFHFAYTQTSFWDLDAPSAPFADTSYKPEFFWQSHNYLDEDKSLLKGIFFQSGIQHESNGKAEEESRSSNYIYVKPTLMFYDDESHYGLMLSPKVWNWVGNDKDTNPDLKKYRGYFELETKIGRSEDFVFGALFRWAEKGTSVQLDFSYPLNNIFYNVLDLYFYAQYVDMIGESLIDYEDRNRAFRLGLAITR